MKSRVLYFGVPVLFLFLSISHVPASVFKDYFDKNATAQLVALCLVSIILGFFLLLRVRRFQDMSLLPILGLALLLVVAWSTLNSGDITGSLMGDVARFTGAISLFSLALIGYFHFSIADKNYLRLIYGYLTVLTVFQIVGFLEFYKVVEIPNTFGFSSTLGNLDFYSAFVGTSFPLYFLLILTPKSLIQRVHFVFGIGLSVSSLYLNGAKQGYVDLALFVVLAIAFLFRSRIKSLLAVETRSSNQIAFIGGLLLTFWVQIIFLIPFLDVNIKGITDDVNVEVRGQYWSAALNIFAEHPIFGVGPDQYGNYYEKFRAIESVLLTARVVSNDAHSSIAQTLATLGILGTIGFLAINFIVLKAWVIAMRRKSSPFLWIFLAYYIVYTTNSVISPITLPNKYLFWSICGLVVGIAYLVRESESQRTIWNRRIVFSVTVILLPLIAWNTFKFSQAQFEFMKTFQERKEFPERVLALKPNDYLPCPIYYFGLLEINAKRPLEAQLNVAREQIRLKPRCNFAILNLFSYEISRKDYVEASKYVPLLIDQAPTRGEVLEKLAEFARATNDQELLAKVLVQAEKLGLLVKQEANKTP